MSVDPDRPSDAAPTPPKSQAEPTGENAEAVHLKRRFKKSGSENEEGEKPDQTIELLNTLLQDLIAKKEQPAAPEPEPKAAKYHRLSKTGSGSPAIQNEAPAPPPTPAETAPAPAATFRPATALEPAAVTRRVRRLHILYILGALALAGAAYYLGSHPGKGDYSSAAADKTVSPPTSAWDDAALNQLDKALAADQAGDLKGAQRIASALMKPGVSALPGLELYLASLGTRQDHAFDVEANLLRALNGASPEAAAAINERLAFNFSRARDFSKAADYFKAASRFNPFSASLYYHWGETLRHLGHFQEATDLFRQALDRVPTGRPEANSLRECILLKGRLTLVEQARDGEFQPELAEQLKAPQPSGYWLLTAAAVALQHKNLPEAASDLGRARDALGKATFDELLNDYFFRAYADRKELADFFPPDAAAQSAQLQPTMAYTVEP